MHPGSTRHLPARALQPVAQDPRMKPQGMKPQGRLLQNKSSRTVHALSWYQSIKGPPPQPQSTPTKVSEWQAGTQKLEAALPFPSHTTSLQRTTLNFRGHANYRTGRAPHCKKPGRERGGGGRKEAPARRVMSASVRAQLLLTRQKLSTGSKATPSHLPALLFPIQTGLT